MSRNRTTNALGVRNELDDSAWGTDDENSSEEEAEPWEAEKPVQA